MRVQIRHDVIVQGQEAPGSEASGGLARRGGHRSLELRAATSLNRLLARHGHREEARRALGDVYGWFTEGFDTADLEMARELLDSLERPGAGA